MVAAVQVPTLFSDHMVLQQGGPIPVWGWADAGEAVTVTLGTDTIAASAGADGRWQVALPARIASDAAATLTIAGTNTITCSDVLIGEVWVCSGQSNMERQLGPRPGQQEIVNWKQEVTAAHHPTIRQFHVKRTKADQPATTVAGSWAVCSPETVADFTAVGYFFGRDLQAARKVPVGLIHSSWGGSSAEQWTSDEVLKADPRLVTVFEDFSKDVSEFPAKAAKFKEERPALMKKWETEAAAAKAAGRPEPKKPQGPRDHSGNRPTCLFNGMIAPLIPYGIRGVVWYQGESNSGKAAQYRSLFPAMIGDWRQRWKLGDFPFLFVQIAPNVGIKPEIRDAQLYTWNTVPNTAMAVITDCGDPNDIHPPHKQPVGARLALAARAIAYGEQIEYSGPRFTGIKPTGATATVSFDHTGSGLVAKDGALKGFEIAGADKVFVAAQAEILGATVVVQSPQVPQPVAVRYGWSNVPDVNLFNAEGLPASPFTSGE
jgi:sialate O-acetylesterase